MPDRFKCFSDLELEMRQKRDYRIDYEFRRNARFLILAPHGGKIEKGTTELAYAIAGAEFSYYSFLGLRDAGNSELHITSHKFDEPLALTLAAKTPKIIGVHGRRDRGDPKTTHIGGLDDELAFTIAQHLRNCGFPAATARHNYPARHRQNICNRGISGSGVQLELPKTLRERLINSEDDLQAYAAAMRRALLD